MSTALPAHWYGDPMLVLERKQARSCNGCEHISKVFGVEVCAKSRRTLVKCHFFARKVAHV